MQKPTFGLCSDASYLSNTKLLEFRVVNIETGQELYRNSFADTLHTTNIGEFFGLVRGIKIHIDSNLALDYPIFSDSQVAIGWVNGLYVNSKNLRKPENRLFFPFVEKGLEYLRKITKAKKMPPVLKWRTDIWGEIPADFDRKK